ncbi:hypothetical protein FQA39_LY07889 [Lamprigera yunnana]|nr:hypothetical protein FQA39_LY07889 [Lamprigera yunnana]
MSSRAKRILVLAQGNNEERTEIASEINSDREDDYLVPHSSDDSVKDKDYALSGSDSESSTPANDGTGTQNDVWNEVLPSTSKFAIQADAATYNFDVDDVATLLDVFKLFVSDDLLDLIANETNRYAR